jgi:hypothetical protein
MTPMLTDALLDQLLSGRHTLRYDGRDVTLTVRRVTAGTSPGGLAVGQFGPVLLTAADVSWPGGRLDQVTVTADEVRLRPALTSAAVLTARSIRIEATVAADRQPTWLPAHRLFDLRIGPDGVLRAVLRAAPRMGAIELEPEVIESSVRLRPRAVRLARSLRIPFRWPAYRVRVPQLPHGLWLTAVEPGPATVTLRGTISRWECELSMTAVAQLLARLSGLPQFLSLPSLDDRRR